MAALHAHPNGPHASASRRSCPRNRNLRRTCKRHSIVAGSAHPARVQSGYPRRTGTKPMANILSKQPPVIAPWPPTEAGLVKKTVEAGEDLGAFCKRVGTTI